MWAIQGRMAPLFDNLSEILIIHTNTCLPGGLAKSPTKGSPYVDILNYPQNRTNMTFKLSLHY